MKLLLVMVVLVAVAGTSMAIQLSGQDGKAILANLTGNNSLNASNVTQNGLSGWGTSHNITIDSGNRSKIQPTENESVMETPAQAIG